MAIAGGEGEVAREHQGIEVNLLGCLGAREGDRRSSTAVGRARRRRKKATAVLRQGMDGIKQWVSFIGSWCSFEPGQGGWGVAMAADRRWTEAVGDEEGRAAVECR